MIRKASRLSTKIANIRNAFLRWKNRRQERLSMRSMLLGILPSSSLLSKALASFRKSRKEILAKNQYRFDPRKTRTASRFESLEARAMFAVDFTGATYIQDFNTLPSTGTAQTWTNDTTIQGWSLFNKTPAAITAINAGIGDSSTGSFYSFGTAGAVPTERALGGTASGGAYFGSPSAGTVAGWITVDINNNTGASVDAVSVNFTGEQWRNGGNATAQTMKMEYGFGATFATVSTWSTTLSTFDFTSLQNTATAVALDGNLATNRTANLGGTLSGLNWANGSHLWLRWIENNDTGNDHGLAIDDFSFSLANAGTSTTTGLASVSPLAANAGDTVTFTGTVVAGAGTTTPSGTIEIRNNGSVLASTTTIGGSGVNGTFSISSATIPVGSYSNLQAFFVAGSGFSSSNSAAFGQTLTVSAVGAATTTGLTSISPTTANAGETISFVGTVVAGSGTATPAGTVEIRNNGATGTLLASTTTIGGSGLNGTFNISSATIPAGSYGNIQAFFVPGSTAFQSSNSTTFATPLTINATGATVLTAGDIAVIGYNTGGTPDSFTIVTLRDLAAGTTFYVNDNEVAAADGTAFTDLAEFEAAFTVKTGQTIPAGTVITLPWGGNAVDATTYTWSNTTGAGLGNNNDEIYIYTAASITSTTPTAFIYGAAIGTSASSRPSGLTAASSFITPNNATSNGAASRYKTTGATYTGDKATLLAAIGDTTANWEPSAPAATGDWTFSVTSATNTTASLTTVSPLTANAGDSITFSGTIVAASGTATPVGTIEIRSGATVLASTTTIGGTGINGTFSVSSSTVPVGTYSDLKAFFVAGNGFNSSASTVFGSTLTVNAVGANTTTSLTGVSPSSVVVGNDVTFTGTVVAGSGTATPIGVIEIRDGGAAGTLLARTTTIGGSGVNGTFSITSSTVPTGVFTNVQAFFVGGTGFLNSNSSASSLTVTPVGATTLGAGDVAVIGYNTQGTPADSITILALKTLGAGTVFFVNDNEVAAPGTAFTDLAEMEASFTVKTGQSIPAGTVITLPWGSAAVSATAYDWSNTTNAGLGNNNEEIYIYTAAALTDTTPTAFIFGTKIGSSTTAAGAGLTAGTTFISPTGAAARYKPTGATYSGDQVTLLTSIGDTTNNWEASSPVNTYDWSFRVAPTVATTTTLDSVSPLTVNQGDQVTIAGTIVAGTGSGTPAGTIQIRDGGATGTLLASTTTFGGSGVNGTYSISSTTIPAGTFSSIQAFFVPANGFGASSSSVFGSTLTVNAVGASTTTTLTNVSPLASTQGDAITFAGAVVAASGTATPVGTIEIRNGATVLASTTAISGSGVNGTYSFSVTTIPAGTYSSIQAFFVPATGFVGSNSSVFGSTLTVAAPANVVNLTTIGAPYSQNFDTLASTGTTSSTTPLGWLFAESGTNANTTYGIDTGASSTGNTYSYGSAASAERALGGLRSSSLVPTIGAAIKNNTGVPIGALTLAFTGEQWRLGAAGRVDQLDFQYSLDATSLTTGTWIDVNSLDFTAPVTAGTLGALDGNAVANKTAVSANITGLNIANNATFYVRWNDLDAAGSDDGLAIDDVSITPAAGNVNGLIGLSSATYNVSEDGGTATVTVNRNGGTTGAVSVDYSTVTGGTAVAGTDYTSVNGTLNWADGETGAKTFTISIIDNSVLGLNKSINIAITNPTGGSALDTNSSGTVFIRENERTSQLLLNELEVNPPTNVDRPFEYVELRGDASASLANWYVVQLDGTNSTAGNALFVSELSNANVGSNGLLVITATSGGHTIPSGTSVVNNTALDGTTSGGLFNSSQTMALIFSTTPIALGQDLDTNNDGTLDLPAGAALIDVVGWLNPANATDVVYGGVALTQASGTPDGATRFVGDTTAKSATAWYNGDLFDNGTSTLNSEKLYDTTKASANLPANAALTPGAPNVQLSTGLSIAASQTALPEGNSGSTPFTFTITRAGDLSGATDVTWTVAGLGATPADAADFVGGTLPTGTASFAANESTKTITVNVQGDTTIETNEAFSVTLTNPTGGASITVSSANSTITSDDLQTLSVGDIVITGIDATDPDEFSFVPLVALAPFTEIRFTDNGWLAAGGFRTGEGVLLYTAPSTGIAAGTEVGILNSTGSTYVTAPTTGQGTVVLESGSFAINNGGDSLTVFQGLLTSPTPIFSITTNRAAFDADAADSSTTALPAGLAAGTNAVAIGGATASIVNAEYSGTTTGTLATLRTAASTKANWTPSATRVSFNYSNWTVSSSNNSAPSVTAGGSATFNGSAVVIDNTVTVTDSDSTSLVGATISLTTGFTTGQDVLGFVNANGITGSYNATTGVLTLSGSSTVANYQAALRSVTYNNTNASPNTATRTVAFQVNDGASANNLSNSATSTITVNNISSQPLFVPSVVPSITGFSIQFNRPVDAAKINLYDQGITLGAADVTLVGATTGPVRGSLIFNSANTGFTFVKTGGVTATTSGALAPDTYTLTMRSSTTDGFVDLAGNALRDVTGNTAGNYVSSFTVSAPAAGAITVGIPDFARGFSQAVNVPANAVGLPVILSNANNVAVVDFTVTYNPALLTITGFTATNTSASVVVNTSTPGQVRVSVTSTTALASANGIYTLGTFAATVPTTAPYASKEVLQFTSIAINDASAQAVSIPAIADNAVHVAAFFGDTSGNLTYGGNDALLLQRIVVGTNTGFTAYQLADPFIVGDISANAAIGGNDALFVQRAVVGTAVPAIPALPSGVTAPPAGGPDPKMFIPQDLVAADVDPSTAGIQVDIPVKLLVTDAAGIDISDVDFQLDYDPAKLSITSSSISVGNLLSGANLLGSSFSGVASVANGRVSVSYLSDGGTVLFPLNTTGDLFKIRATIVSGATGTVTLNLRGTSTAIYANDAAATELTLSPAPTDGSNDVVDGLLTLNLPPVFGQSTYSFGPVSTGSANGAVVGTVTATDPDAGTTLTYSITAGNTGNAFAIDNTGKLTVATASALTAGSYSLTLQASDGSLTATATATVSVISNSAPVISNQAFTINSKSVANAPVGTVVASDANSGDTLTYSITAGNVAGAFAINATIGAITLLDPTKLPSIAKGQTSVVAPVLTVQVSDNGVPSLSATATVTVTISTTGRTAPILTAATFSLNENNKDSAKVGAIKPAISYAGQKFGSFVLSGADAASFAIDSAKGTITVKSGVTLNKEAKASYSFKVTVADSVTSTLTTTANVTVTVNDVNEAPVISVAASGIGNLVSPLTKGVATISIDEHTPTSVAVNDAVIGSMTAFDPDNLDSDTLQTLAYTLVGGTPVAGSQTKTLDKTGAFEYDSATGIIKIVDATKVSFEKSKSFKLAFTVADNGTPKALVTKATVVISLNDKNEAPVFDAKQLSSFSVAEVNKADAKVGAIKAKDADKNGESVSYAFVVNGVLSQTFGPFKIDAASGVITVPTAGALDFETTSSYSVTVRATDSNATDAKFSDLPLTISVTDVNEAATIVFKNTAATPVPVTTLSLSLATLTGSVGTTLGTKIGTFEVADVDAGAAGAKGATFTDASKGGLIYDTLTGAITVGDKSKLVAGKSYKITLLVADSSGKPVKSKLDVLISITA